MSFVSLILKNLEHIPKLSTHYHVSFTTKPFHNRIICFNDFFCNIGVIQSPLKTTNNVDDVEIRQDKRYEFDVVTFVFRLPWVNRFISSELLFPIRK